MINLGNVFILGDSYSTFEKFVPTGYATWYYNVIVNDTDVNNVNFTWWKQLFDECDSNLVLNSSWSGTTICNTGYNGDCSKTSFIGRFDQLIESKFFKQNRIDTLFVFGGTNDSSANSPIGKLMYSDWHKDDLYSVLPAFCYLLYRLKTNLPSTRIICIFNTGLKREIVDNCKIACDKYEVEKIELKDIEKLSGHPNKVGMTQIKEQVLNFLFLSMS